MLNYINKKRGQSTLEYAVLIIIIIGALLSIQVYIKRGISGRLKQASDDIGDQFSVGNTNVVKTMTTSSRSNDTFNQNTGTKSQMLAPEVTTEVMNSNIINVNQEFWGNG